MIRLLLAALLLPSVAWAHGGLPVSQAVLRRGETLFIPVVFWGLWVGPDNGPWKWICEEVINTNRTRRYALSADGTFYTTDTRGVTVSNDDGCSWSPAGGELAELSTSDVAADASDGATAWVTTDEVVSDADGGLAADNGLFVTHDHGASFARVAALSGSGRRFHDVQPAGAVLYVTSAGLRAPFEVALHRSGDGGQSFETRPLAFTVDGAAPHGAEVMAVDPRDPNVIYVRAFVTAPAPDGGRAMPLQVLLRSEDGGVTVSELLRMVGEMTPAGATRGIDGVAVDPGRGRVYVATSKGLFAGDDGASVLTPTGGLSQAQCVEMKGSAVYVCSSNYSPDFAALARSDDGAATFQSVLSYQATLGPIECPRGTPVGDQCPLYWTTYSSQLGIESSDGGTAGGDDSCACSLGRRAPDSRLGWWILVAGLVTWRRYLLSRRRSA